MVTKFSNVSPITIKYPILTDTSIGLLKNRKYTFIVDRYSDKSTIKAEIESLYQVKVVKINTCHIPPKKKRVRQSIGWAPKYKRAIITLAANNKIPIFEDI